MHPVVEIIGPHGKQGAIELVKDRVTIGRFGAINDIGLEPDPQQLVSRKAHCVLERDIDGWWVIDNGSVNRTFLSRDGVMNVVNGRAPIRDGEAVRILGLIGEDGEPGYWELLFHDPLATNPAPGVSRVAYLEYDWLQARLFRIEGSSREEIGGLRLQEHKLIRYMDHRNRETGNKPVLCTYDELIMTVWEEPDHAEAEINHLVWELRQKIEPDPGQPRFLQSVRGLGYRLETRPLQ